MVGIIVVLGHRPFKVVFNALVPVDLHDIRLLILQLLSNGLRHMTHVLETGAINIYISLFRQKIGSG